METLKDLNPRNPLGIIALFVSFCYLLSSIVISINISNFTDYERSALVIFIILFPLIIFCAFFILVVGFHSHLYAPKDFRTDMAFWGNTIAAKADVDKKKEDEISELKTAGVQFSFMDKTNKSDRMSQYDEYEYKALRYIERKYSMFIKRDVRIGTLILDAIGLTNRGDNYLIEIKMKSNKDILMKAAGRLVRIIQTNDRYKAFIPLLIVLTNKESEINHYIPELIDVYPTIRIESVSINTINEA